MAMYDPLQTYDPLRDRPTTAANRWVISDEAGQALQPVARNALFPDSNALFPDSKARQFQQSLGDSKPTREQLQMYGIREMTPSGLPVYRLPQTPEEMAQVDARLRKTIPAREQFLRDNQERQDRMHLDSLASGAAPYAQRPRTGYFDKLTIRTNGTPPNDEQGAPPLTRGVSPLAGASAGMGFSIPLGNYDPVKRADYKPYMEEYRALVGDITPEMQARAAASEQRLAKEESGNLDNQLMRFGLGMLGKKDFYGAVGDSGTAALDAYLGNKDKYRQERDQLMQAQEDIARQKQMQTLQSLGLAQRAAGQDTDVALTNKDLELKTRQIEATVAAAMQKYGEYDPELRRKVTTDVLGMFSKSGQAVTMAQVSAMVDALMRYMVDPQSTLGTTLSNEERTITIPNVTPVM